MAHKQVWENWNLCDLEGELGDSETIPSDNKTTEIKGTQQEEIE